MDITSPVGGHAHGLTSPDQRRNDSPRPTLASFTGLLEWLPDAVVIVNEAGRIVLVNTHTEALFGHARGELLDTPVEALLPERFRAGHLADRTRYAEVPRVRPMGTGQMFFGVRKDGTEFPVEISLSPIDSADGRLVVAVIRDVTKRRQIERDLREKNEALQKATLTKDRFLASMSHELRTPLNAIIGFTGTLLMKLPGPLVEQQETQLKIVKASAGHLLSLINNLLDLSKIESGKVDIRLSSVPCSGVLDEVVSALTPLAREKGLEIGVGPSTSDCAAETDRRVLTQILLNLAGNAIAFSARGTIRLAADRHGDSVRISVSDDGLGIGPEDQVRLFEAFDQFQTTPGEQHHGSGLALHLSRELARLLRAQLTLESEPDRGTTFALTLPAASATVVSQAGPS